MTSSVTTPSTGHYKGRLEYFITTADPPKPKIVATSNKFSGKWFTFAKMQVMAVSRGTSRTTAEPDVIDYRQGHRCHASPYVQTGVDRWQLPYRNVLKLQISSIISAGATLGAGFCGRGQSSRKAQSRSEIFVKLEEKITDSYKVLAIKQRYFLLPVLTA